MNSDVVINNEIQAIYPANSLQQGFIFHAVSHPLDDAYIVQSLFDYDDEIDVDAYQKAWALVIQAYPTLRLCFNWDELPVQIITTQGAPHFIFHDLSKKIDKNSEIESLQHADRQLGFDLTKPTLLRIHFIKQSNTHYTVLKTEHHSIADAWSAATLLNQVHYFYDQLIKGESPRIIQDVAYLQAQAYITKHQAESQTHWQKKLAHLQQGNDINVLLTKPANQAQLSRVNQAQEITVELEMAHYERLKNIVQNEALTMHGIVQFAWHKMLHAYTQDAQTIVGTTLSGRALPITDIEKSVGLYINTLPLIVNWDNAFTVKEQLHHIHQEIMELNKYSFVYLSSLQASGNRLFNSLLLFENLSVPVSKAGLSKKLIAANRRNIQKLNYPIVISIYFKNNTLAINLKYDGTYLSDTDANQLLKKLLFILQQIPCRLHAPHHAIDLLTPKEYQKIIHTWNETTVDYPDNHTLDFLFEKQVKRTPNHIAIIFEEQQLTYHALDIKANQLAHWLYEKGLHQGELVALCLDRSFELLIAILAVLKAGCAYVPIDPEYPLERMSHVLKETKSRFLLTQSQFGDHLYSITSDTLIPVFLDRHPYENASLAPLLIPRESTSIAYVIYTSGTTGKPKGVAITHKGAVNRLDWMQRTYPLNESDVVLQKTPYGFDVSVWELLWAHWSGARIVMARPDGHKDPQYLQSLIEKEKVTVLHFVPSMLSAFTETLQSFKIQAPSCLRYVFCSGEALLANQVDAFYKVCGDTVTIHNLYGPTEASIDVTFFDCPRGVAQVYIGKPIQNTRVYILTADLKPVPIGGIGELYLGGAGLAREYWQQPELTAAAFINNPFASKADVAQGYTRLYKTGDRVKWHADGNIEYLGRNDAQVKIRGFRIELSEIEQVMLSCANVLQAVALVKEHNSNDLSHRFIAAYYVGSVSENELQAYLEKHLPDYMLPTSLMALDYFPVTRNGKLDRNAFPLPSFLQKKHHDVSESRSALETALCDIWKSVLNIPHITIADNFFELGGDSIRSIRLLAKMQAIGFNVSVNDIFKHKTILQLIENTDHEIKTIEKSYTPFSLIENTPTSQKVDNTPNSKKNNRASDYSKIKGQSRDALEKSLQAIWEVVLDVKPISRSSNFFELGGDSIRSIRVLAKMHEIGFYVSVNDIFKYKTIAELINNTNHSVPLTQENYASFSLVNNASSTKILNDNKLESIEDVYPASYLQMGMLVESLKTEAEGTYHDVFAYNINRAFNETLLIAIFKSLSVKHPLLRTAFVGHADYAYVCVQYAEINIASHFAGIVEQNVSEFIQAEKNKIFHADKPGLFRLFILNPTPDKFILVFSFHHAISDGWSVASLMAEFTEAYFGNKSTLNAENIPLYQDVIQQERLALASAQQELFWRDYLANSPLPVRHFVFHPKRLLEKNLELGYIVGIEKSAQIISKAKALGVSPDVIFLSTFFKVLSRFGNDDDVIIGLVMNNRLEKTGGDKVFGLHLNTLPLRMQVSNHGVKFTEKLALQKTIIEGYKAYPYGKIRTDVMKSNDSYTCAFNYMHFHVADTAFDSKNLSAAQLFEKTTIPLTLHVSRHHDNFRVVIKALNGFIDNETAEFMLTYFKHDLNAVIDDLEFSWLSEDDLEHFCNWNKDNRLVIPKNQFIVEMRPARNALEQSLCELWQSVLDVPCIGITENFFELGGDSIRSIRLIAKMQEIGFHVSVGDIFKYQTILALVENTQHTLELQSKKYFNYSLVNEETRRTWASSGVQDIYPAGHFQKEMLMESCKENSEGTYHDVFAYTINRAFNETRLLAIFKNLSIKHPVLRTAFVTHPDYGYVCLQYADIDIGLHYGGIIQGPVSEFIKIEKNRTLAMSMPGLFSLFILNPTPEKFVFIFSFHHAIADGWSVASLIAEFATAFANESNDIVTQDKIPLYQQVIQQEYFSLTASIHKNFWNDYLSNAPLLDNFSIKKTTYNKYIELDSILDHEKSIRILSLSKRLGVSVDIIFLAAYFKALSHYLNYNEIILGVVMNNRLEESGGDKVFGLHLNILPMRINSALDNMSDAFILALADERLKIVPHKVYPYAKICLDLNQPGGFYNFAFNYTHFHIHENQSKEKIIQPIYAFEKMAIPFTLQILRSKNEFRLIIRTTEEFTDAVNAKNIVEFINNIF